MRVPAGAAILALLSGTTGFAAGVSGEESEPSQDIAGAEQGAAVELASIMAVPRSLRPSARPGQLEGTVKPVEAAADNQRFHNWIRAFRQRAAQHGIDDQLLDAAFRDVRYDPEVVRRDRNQNEFTKTIWDYLDTAVSQARIANGQAALKKNAAVLEQIEKKYGVDKQIIVAIWGLESAYGGFRGNHNVVESLATLAFDTRRPAFFEEQLLAALSILQSGDTTPDRMKGSWAGAMGHTQFMPTSYLDYAVDFTGDGRRDIWSDDPSDALASAAAYLAAHGWTYGQPWGVEVALPEGFDYRQAARENLKQPGDWAALGVLGTDGAPVPEHGPASILLPAGGQGAAFMIFSNFEVLEAYNTADAYVIGVGHLGDRIIGGDPIRADWPRQDRALTLKERKELQTRLTDAGFDTVKIDGRIGPLTINAVREFQIANGLLPDGYASLTLLQRLR